MNDTRGETILVVEDDRSLREGLKLNLEIEGYRVEVAEDGVEGMKKAFDTKPDLMILDIMLPGWSGLDILTELRSRNQNVPVLILSARGRIDHKVEGLKTGADDYLSKPFELPELLARVEAMLRRRRADRTAAPRLRFGAIELDRSRHQVFVAGTEVLLSVKEFGVLCLLAEAPDRPHTRQEILDRVWGWDFVGSPRTVDNFIVSLRQKLEKDPAKPRHIITIRGVGYKLVVAGG